MQLNHNGEEYISYPKYINKDELINKLNEIYSDKNYYISDSVDLINNLTYIYQNYINISDYNILDIGCNIGTYSFLSYFNNAKYVEGIDFNCDFINIANETKNKLNINDTSIKFINSDIFDIDFSYEHEIGECIPSIIANKKRIFKGIAIQDIVQNSLNSDLQIEYNTGKQKVDEIIE